MGWSTCLLRYLNAFGVHGRTSRYSTPRSWSIVGKSKKKYCLVCFHRQTSVCPEFLCFACMLDSNMQPHASAREICRNSHLSGKIGVRLHNALLLFCRALFRYNIRPSVNTGMCSVLPYELILLKYALVWNQQIKRERVATRSKSSFQRLLLRMADTSGCESICCVVYFQRRTTVHWIKDGK